MPIDFIGFSIAIMMINDEVPEGATRKPTFLDNRQLYILPYYY